MKFSKISGNGNGDFGGGLTSSRSTQISALLSLLVLLSISCSRSHSHEASETLSESEMNDFKSSIIHYIAELPKNATHESKFDPKFSEHYVRQTDRFRLDKYYQASDGYIYFELSRNAPSFKIKRVATGGRLKYDLEGTVVEYEEIYRTWKMEEEDLNRKTGILFTKMTAGDDLSPYQTINSEEEYIEFPDEKVRYDKEERRWVGSKMVFQSPQ